MRRMMSQDDVGASIDQLVRKCPVLRADIVHPVCSPMNCNHDVVNLRRNRRMSSLIRNGSMGAIPGRPAAANADSPMLLNCA
jgi:hypothetical protein